MKNKENTADDSKKTETCYNFIGISWVERACTKEGQSTVKNQASNNYTTFADKIGNEANQEVISYPKGRL